MDEVTVWLPVCPTGRQLDGDTRPRPYRAICLGEDISRADAEVALDELVEDGQVPDDTYKPVVVTAAGQEMTWLAGDRPGDRAFAVCLV